MTMPKTELKWSIFPNMARDFSYLSDESLGKLIKALNEYVFCGEITDFSETELAYPFSSMTGLIDLQIRSQKKMSLTQSIRGRISGLNDSRRDVANRLIRELKDCNGGVDSFISDHCEELQMIGILSGPRIEKPTPEGTGQTPMNNDINMYADRPEPTDNEAPPEQPDDDPYENYWSQYERSRGGNAK